MWMFTLSNIRKIFRFSKNISMSMGACHTLQSRSPQGKRCWLNELRKPWMSAEKTEVQYMSCLCVLSSLKTAELRIRRQLGLGYQSKRAEGQKLRKWRTGRHLAFWSEVSYSLLLPSGKLCHHFRNAFHSWWGRNLSVLYNCTSKPFLYKDHNYFWY